MTKDYNPDSQPQLGSVVEISRRLKTRQRPEFEFLNRLHQRPQEQSERGISIKYCSPKLVRVNLVSRFDNLNPMNWEKTAGLSHTSLYTLFDVERTSTCNKYSTLTLGEAVLSDKENGWQAVELPVTQSDRSFSDERAALTNKIGQLLEDENRLWTPEEPALQIVEFMAEPFAAEAILEFVQEYVPKKTEVFDASVRFRDSVLLS